MNIRQWLAFLLLTTLPAQADTFSGAAKITHVTLYPEGARVEREVVVDLPPGQHKLLIADLPHSLAEQGVRVDLPENLGLISQIVLSGQQQQLATPDQPELIAPNEEIAKRAADLRDAQAKIGQIEARAEAARSKARALQAMLSASMLPTDATALARLSDMVETETLAALQAAKVAEAEIAEERAALEPLQQALDRAIADQKARDDRRAESATLALTLNSTGGPATIHLRSLGLNDYDTGWKPKYEIFLNSGPAANLLIKRSVVISQTSGENWQDVDLTLSTAEPARYLRPSDPYIRSYSIMPKPQESDQDGAENDCDPGCGGPVVVAENPLLSAEMVGQTLQYTFPEKLSVPNDTESLTLALDDLSVPAETFALVNADYTDKAYLMAKFTNTTDTMLLPGQVQVYRDGVQMGEEQLDLVLPGQDGELGFGELVEIVVEKGWPDKMESSRGFFVTETERRNGTTVSVENHSDRAWPLVIRAGIPQSEHENLEISYESDPAETLRNKGGQPGLMEWQKQLEVGDSYRVEYVYTMRWPEGMILQ